MTGDLINTALGLIIGLLTGYVFERRATNAARAHADELERELSAIRHSVLSMGGELPRPSTPGTDGTLDRELLRRALATQNSEGRVTISALKTHFLAHGHSPAALDEALHRLYEAGEAEEDQRWLVLK